MITDRFTIKKFIVSIHSFASQAASYLKRVGARSFDYSVHFCKTQITNLQEMRNIFQVKRISFFLLFFGSAWMFSSCKKTYESLPLDQLTDQYIWDQNDSNATYASQYLSSIYASLPVTLNRIGQDFMDAASDDAISSQTSQSPIELIGTGGITIFSNPDNTWITDYTGVRLSTIFLNNFSIVPFKNADERRSWFGEARIMRAFFYWELLRRYGGVPLLGDSVRTLTDNVELPRNSFQQCVDYIVAECDRASDSLRSDPVDMNHLGRWSKAGAMSLKARVLLFAASPLYNGENTGTELTGYSANDPMRWKLAADAANDIIHLNKYSLEPVFQDAFLSQKSVEVIFAHLKELGTSVETINGPIGFSTAPGAGNTSPTAELADAFGMINGLPISDPLSRYNPDSPYLNRDHRFAATLFYNGAKWLNSSIETFEGGICKPGGTITQTRTGYYLRKFMGNFENQTSYSNQYHDFVYFRYAEVLLNFAEARNEFSGPDGEVFSAVEKIRKRAHLIPYTLDRSISKDAMREIIRNERRKELAFEEHRYWDIRRWKIAGQVYNKPLHGIQIIKNSMGELNYTVLPVITTKFDESKMYFYPIPYNEVASNKNMKQNLGW